MRGVRKATATTAEQAMAHRLSRKIKAARGEEAAKAAAELARIELPEPKSPEQIMALACTAKIMIFGGRAGGGKTWFLCREVLNHLRDPYFRGVLFRRTGRQAEIPGSLRDEADLMYRPFGAETRKDRTQYLFPSGATLEIGHLQHDSTKHDWAGAQPTYMGFDQLEQFQEGQFWFVALSRGRSRSETPTYIRATANPVPPSDWTGGWLAKLLMGGGWVDEKTGLAVDSMAGVVRWFYRNQKDRIIWYDSKEEAFLDRPDMAERDIDPISFSFINAPLADIVREKNPTYESGLEGLPWIERMRLTAGNWKVSSAGGGIVRSEWFRQVAFDPAYMGVGEPMDEDQYRFSCRAWDLAATQDGGDRTCSVKGGRLRSSGRVVIRDVSCCRKNPGGVRQFIGDTMIQDGYGVAVVLPQDGGQAGKDQVHTLTNFLRQYAIDHNVSPPRIMVTPTTGSKLDRGAALRQEVEPAKINEETGDPEIYGNVDIVARGEETDDYLTEIHHFDASRNCADDFWDATADMMNVLVRRSSNRGLILG